MTVKCSYGRRHADGSSVESTVTETVLFHCNTVCILQCVNVLSLRSDLSASGVMLITVHCVQSNKPLMEKRRRERINTCLDQLKAILMDVTKKEVSALDGSTCLFKRHSAFKCTISRGVARIFFLKF